MTTTPATVHMFRNAVRRPVELHLAGRTTVLLPGQTIELPGDEPYCRGLVARGVLTRHERPEPEPEPQKAPRRSRAKKKPPARTTSRASAPKSPAGTTSRASAKKSAGGGATTPSTRAPRPAAKRTPPRDTNGTDTDRTAGEHP